MTLGRRIINALRNTFGFPTEFSVFPEAGAYDGEPLVKGKPGPVLGELPDGTYFAVVGKENYPKVKEGIGYYDLSFQLRHNSPSLKWETVLYTKEQVREIFVKKGISADKIDTLLTQRRTVDHDGQV